MTWNGSTQPEADCSISSRVFSQTGNSEFKSDQPFLTPTTRKMSLMMTLFNLKINITKCLLELMTTSMLTTFPSPPDLNTCIQKSINCNNASKKSTNKQSQMASGSPKTKYDVYIFINRKNA